MEKVRAFDGAEKKLNFNEPVLWIMLEGNAQVKVDGIKDPVRFTRGETVLLPHIEHPGPHRRRADHAPHPKTELMALFLADRAPIGRYVMHIASSVGPPDID